jgi:hypothetical protein
MGEMMLPRFGDGTVDNRGDAEGVKGTGNEPEMADRDVGTLDEVTRGGHI